MPLQFTNTRDRAHSGLWLLILVPVGLIRTGHHSLAADILVTTTLLFALFAETSSALLFTCGLSSSFLITLSLGSNIPFRQVFVLGFTIFCTRNFLCLFPKSFTVGEAFLLSHLLIVFLHSSPLFLIIFICLFLFEYYSIPCTPICILGLLSLIAFASFAFLVLFLPNFSFWYVFKLKQFWCFFTPLHAVLLITWACLLFFSTILTLFYGRCARSDIAVLEQDYRVTVSSTPYLDKDRCSTQQNEHVESKMSPSHLKQLPQRYPHTLLPETPLWLRKVFHFNAGLVFAIGLQFAPDLLSFCATALLGLFGLFEWLRRRGPEPIMLYLRNVIDPFRDEKDSGTLVFTPIALLLGLSIPVWWPDPIGPKYTVNIARHCPLRMVSPFAWAGVLSIAVGDSMAALVGRAWGRTRWPYSHRTFVGSFSSLLSQLLCWVIIARLNSWSTRSGFLPILLGVLVEAYTNQIDNLVVPLVVMSAFASPVE